MIRFHRRSEEYSMVYAGNQPTYAMAQVHDLKRELGEFCEFWECSRLNSQKACTCCPVVRDINGMVDDQLLQPVSWLPAHSIY